MEFDMDKAGRDLDKKIAQLRGKSYISEELINLLEQVAKRQLAARPDVLLTLPDDSELAPVEALYQGMPLVGREGFPYDAKLAETLLNEFTDLLITLGGPLGTGAEMVRKSLDSGQLIPEELFTNFLEDNNAYFAPWTEKMPEAPKTLSFLAFAALGPSLETAAEILSDKLPEIKVHPVGNCPICGSLPLISSLKEKEGFRHATCSFCRHEYRIKRIACPVCGEEEQKKLTFFTVDEEPGFRVDVCDSCKTYMKTIDFRELDRIAVPVLDDLDSLALDYVAAGQGYKRATLSAWGF